MFWFNGIDRGDFKTYQYEPCHTAITANTVASVMQIYKEKEQAVQEKVQNVLLGTKETPGSIMELCPVLKQTKRLKKSPHAI